MSFIPDCREDEYYNQKYLNAADKEFIKGYDYAVESVLDSFFYNLDSYNFEVDGEDIDIGRFLENHEAIKDKFVDCMKIHFESDRDEMITSMIDHMNEEEYNKIKASVDGE